MELPSIEQMQAVIDAYTNERRRRKLEKYDFFDEANKYAEYVEMYVEIAVKKGLDRDAVIERAVNW